MAHADVSSFASKTKVQVDKTDVDKLKTVLVDLSKLNHVVKNGVVKNTEHDKLVTKVDNIDTAEFVLKTKHDTGKSEI